jgi:hypothetical protein
VEDMLGQKGGGQPNKVRRAFFKFFFPIDLNHIFEQPKTIFRIWNKNKSCLEI